MAENSSPAPKTKKIGAKAKKMSATSKVENREKQMQNTIQQLRLANASHKRQDQLMQSAIRSFKRRPVIANAADAGQLLAELPNAIPSVTKQDLATEIPTSTIVPSVPIVPTSQAPMVPSRSALSYSESPYLRSLLVPEDGPVDIPDDVTRLHTIRSEPLSVNVQISTAAAGSGVLFIYPNHPTSLIGYQYTGVGTPLTNYTYGQRLVTAQQLNLNYDYGRKTSQIVYARSSTLPSGLYAINGTINAVRVDGTISELTMLSDPSTFYSTILAATANPYDKVMSVSVGDGVAALSIPDSFVIPYTRLNDSSPSSVTQGTISVSEITDRSEDLAYILQGQFTADVPQGPPLVDVNEMTMNFDSTLGADFRITVKLSNATLGEVVLVQASVVWLDPFGGLIATTTLESNFAIDAQGISTETMAVFFNPGQASTNFTSSGNDAPIAQIQITLAAAASEAMTDVGFGYDIQVIAPLGARPGVNMPVIVAAYQGVAEGSTLTLTGVTNYELIPNPQARQIIPIDYGLYDPHEMQAVQSVIMNRTKFNIRSLWNAKEYAQNKPAFRSFTTPSLVGGVKTAHALGWSDIVNFMRNRVIPTATKVISAVAPQYKPVADVVNALNGRAASGVVFSRAADDDPLLQDPVVQVYRAHILPHLQKHRKTDPPKSFVLQGVYRDLDWPSFTYSQFIPTVDDVETTLMLKIRRTEILTQPRVWMWLQRRVSDSSNYPEAVREVNHFCRQKYKTLDEFGSDPFVMKGLYPTDEERQDAARARQLIDLDFSDDSPFRKLATELLYMDSSEQVEKSVGKLIFRLLMFIRGEDFSDASLFRVYQTIEEEKGIEVDYEVAPYRLHLQFSALYNTIPLPSDEIFAEHSYQREVRAQDDVFGKHLRDHKPFNGIVQPTESDESEEEPNTVEMMDFSPFHKRIQELKAEASSRHPTRLINRKKAGPPRLQDYVMFPTIVSDPNDKEVGEQMYLVTHDSAELRSLLSEPGVFTPCVNGKKIFGLRRDDIFLASPPNDLLVLPCDGRGQIQLQAPIVSGHSLGGAVWVLLNTPKTDHVKIPITGDVQLQNGKAILLPNPCYSLKALFCHRQGLPLIGANENADIRITNMSEYTGVSKVVKAFGKPHSTK